MCDEKKAARFIELLCKEEAPVMLEDVPAVCVSEVLRCIAQVEEFEA